MTRLGEAAELLCNELGNGSAFTRRCVEHGLQKAIAAGLIVEANCTCPVGFGQVRSPSCPMHGNRAPYHTVTGPTP